MHQRESLSIWWCEMFFLNDQQHVIKMIVEIFQLKLQNRTVPSCPRWKIHGNSHVIWGSEIDTYFCIVVLYNSFEQEWSQEPIIYLIRFFILVLSNIKALTCFNYEEGKTWVTRICQNNKMHNSQNHRILRKSHTQILCCLNNL